MAKGRLILCLTSGQECVDDPEVDVEETPRDSREIGTSEVVPPARFQRATFRLGGGRSMQLSYGSTSEGIVIGEYAKVKDTL